MKVEIKLDQLRAMARESLGQRLIADAFQQEFDKIFERHKAEMCKEMKELAEKATFQVVQNCRDFTTSIHIETPE